MFIGLQMFRLTSRYQAGQLGVRYKHYYVQAAFKVKRKSLLSINFVGFDVKLRTKATGAKEKVGDLYSYLRPVRLVLTDNLFEPYSFFNDLKEVSDIDANVVACSTHLLKYMDDLQNMTHHYVLNDWVIDELLEDVEFKIVPKICKSSGAGNTSDADSWPSLTISAATDEQEIETKKLRFEKVNFIIEDKEKCFSDWENSMEELKSLCQDYSLSIIYSSLAVFFNDVARLKFLSAGPHRHDWHSSSLVASFINFLVKDEKQLEMAQPALHKYLQYCLSRKDYKTFLNVYNKIKPHRLVYNSSFLRLLISGLGSCSMLDEAKELFQLAMFYNEKKLMNDGKILPTYAKSCFECGDSKTGIDIFLQDMKASGIANNLLLDAFLSCFKYSKDAAKWKENQEVVASLFNWMYVNDIHLTSSTIKLITAWFKSIENENWYCSTYDAYHIRSGYCPITRQKMKICQLSQNEFNYLEKSLSQSLLQRSAEDVNLDYFQEDLKTTADAPLYLYHLSSMKEIKKFLDYLYDNGPFDLMVDGMNFAYSLSDYESNRYFGKHKFQTAFSRLGHLLSTYKRSIRDDTNICLIFRKHIDNDVKEDGSFLFDLCNVYFAGHGVSDDVLMLYSAIASGPHCYFASNDLFRNYRYNIIAKRNDRNLLRIYDRYQSSRQLFWKGRRSRPYLASSSFYEPVIYKNKNSWHFPFISTAVSKSKTYNTNVPSSWMCAVKH